MTTIWKKCENMARKMAPEWSENTFIKESKYGDINNNNKHAYKIVLVSHNVTVE